MSVRSFAAPERAARSRLPRLISSLALGAVVACTLACTQRAPTPPASLAAAASDSPNVLLISLDTLRADRLGSHGYHRPTTPFLDRLAAGGIRYSRAFVNTHGTPPSHTTLLSSRYQESHGVSLRRLGDRPDHRLPAALPILPEILRQAGYTTLAVTDGGLLSSDQDFDRGFGVFHDRYRGARRGMDKLLSELASAGAAGKPIFAFYHTYEIHSPYDPPQPYRDMFGEFASEFDPTSENLRLFRRNAAGLTADDLALINARYDAGIRYTDDQLERLFAKLESSAFLDNCLIVITSDHGEEFAEHGGMLHPASLYEELLHVPLIIAGTRMPETNMPANRVIDDLVSTIDVMPTILGYLGIQPQPGLQLEGRDLLRSAAPPPAEQRIFAQYADRLYAIRSQSHKLLLDRQGNLALFDLEADPAELRDIARQRPLLAKSLLSELRAWRAERKPLDFGHAAGQDEALPQERLDELRALGYIDPQ